MDRKFTVELDELKQRLLDMGDLAKHALQQAICVLSQPDEEATRRVMDNELAINQIQIEMDARVVHLIVRYQLVAADLRLALAVGRINNELERVGDQAVNIVQAAQRMLQCPPVAASTDILWISNLARAMLRDSLVAFAMGDLETAYSVLRQDDQVDGLRDRLLAQLLAHMVRNPGGIVPAFDHILATESFERVGDHATNIAEDVIYIVAGDDVRHHARNQENREQA